MARLFIGLDVPLLAPLVKRIDQLSNMGPSVRPVRPDAMHITLRFLDEVDNENIDQLCAAIDSAVDDARNEGWLSVFDLKLTHVGTFPELHPVKTNQQPRVVFAAPSELGCLPKITQRLDECIDSIELPIPKRDKPFTVHITLARVKRRRSPDRRVIESIRQMIDDSHDIGLGSIKVKTIKLIESRLTPQGPDYKTRHTTRF